MSVCVLGSINLDIVCRVAELPHPGETIMALDVQRFPGGKGANQAVASAHWGAQTAMIGAVGHDDAGEELLAHLVSAGIDTSGIFRLSDASTGTAYIDVSAAGENMIVVVGGANRAVSAEQIASHKLGSHRVVLAQLETPIEAIAALFTQASGSTKILNGAPAVDEAKKLFPLADVIVVNESELAHYAEIGSMTDSDVVEAARKLMSRPRQQVIVTLGARGVVAVNSSDVISVGGHLVDVVDTTGAGDCFCGVLAASLDEGLAIREALLQANRAAALSTCRQGAAVSSTLRAEVDALS
jgi:ribokinase